MATCIRVTAPSDKWQVIVSRTADTQVDTLPVLLEVPDFIGFPDDDWGTPAAVTKAPGSASGRVLVTVDARGRVQIVACPAKADEAELSGLVADVLTASGKLWHKPYEILSAMFEASLGKPLAEWVQARAGKGWTADAFRSGAEASLSQGRFPVVIVTREKTAAVADTMAYLENMNLPVRLVGYICRAGGGVEILQPVLLGPAAPPPSQETRPAVKPVEPQPQSAQPEPATEGKTPSATEATPKQQEILSVLAGLEELKLTRRGLEYYIPAVGGKQPAEGSIVLAVAQDRWPFPKPDEVIVVVNTGQEHLAGYLKVGPDEITDFLGSLPRDERKEHKGCLLLRASSIGEAHQIVNELKALKAVSFGG